MKKTKFRGFILDKNGFAEEISFDKIDTICDESCIKWLHFDYTSKIAKNWINEKSSIDNIAKDALLAEVTRPRAAVLNDTLLLALRGVNLEPNSKPEDMISIRLYVSKNLIISTSKREVLSVVELSEDLKNSKGVRSSSEFLCELIYKMVDRMDDVIETIHDRTDFLEENLFEIQNVEHRTEILNIRRESIVLKRYLSPQKEALLKLTNEKLSWIDEYQKLQLRETIDQLIRHIEELDTIRDKVVLFQEELVNNLTEQMSKKMYILSILSAIFLPLTFLTGLLGINVGGIPGATNDNAFYIFVAVLISVVSIQFFIFKKSKWI